MAAPSTCKLIGRTVHNGNGRIWKLFVFLVTCLAFVCAAVEREKEGEKERERERKRARELWSFSGNWAWPVNWISGLFNLI